MKIRIRGNSIRYRLTKSEVQTFCNTGRFEETTDFGDVKFTYALEAKEDIETIDARFRDGVITLFLEKQKAKDWFKSTQVGFNHRISTKNGARLELRIEKDFGCMDETLEDQSDHYPNPKMM